METGVTMRLSTRLTIAMVALVLLTATAIGLLTYRNVETVVLPNGLERIANHVHLLAAVVRMTVAAIDLLNITPSLSRPPSD